VVAAEEPGERTGRTIVIVAVAIVIWLTTAIVFAAIGGRRLAAAWVEVARELDPTRAIAHATLFSGTRGSGPSLTAG
jgi:hypothetical protein